jgi:S-adenosyl methyltransferase
VPSSGRRAYGCTGAYDQHNQHAEQTDGPHPVAEDHAVAADFADLAFTGLELVAPGLVPVSEWRPETEPGLIPPPSQVGYLGAVARKP